MHCNNIIVFILFLYYLHSLVQVLVAAQIGLSCRGIGTAHTHAHTRTFPSLLPRNLNFCFPNILVYCEKAEQEEGRAAVPLCCP